MNLSSYSVASSSPTQPTVGRVHAIDVVRGLVMVIMALDHIREFWSPMLIRPEDVAHASVALFLTRWVTHFCAPTFVFLSGTSAWLYAQKQPSLGQANRFLLTRGLWLVMLEIGLITPLLHWNYDLIVLQVIWVIGWSLVLLAGLRWLPRPLLALLAAVIIGGHDALPASPPTTVGTTVWAFLHNPPFVLPAPPFTSFLVAYPIGPWLGILLAGYVVGPWFRLPLPQRVRRLQWAGVSALVLFGLLRATNWYGDPALWSVQPSGLTATILSFFNVTKYPPSLLFVCLTLGVALLLLSFTERASSRLSQWLGTFGQVPFFYYLLHLLLISGSAWVWTRLTFGYAVNFSFSTPADWPTSYQPSLLRAYLVWAVTILTLYWPCRWYQRYRRQHAYWWLSYL
jgi:uncharacterized membrane protein